MKSELTHPKIGSMLDGLIARIEAGEISAEDAAQEAPLHRGDSLAVTIYLSGNVDGVVSFLENNGGSNISSGDDYIEAYVPVLKVVEASEQPGVLRVRVIQPPEAPQSQSEIPGDGSGVHGSLAWNQSGYTGQGIRLGIIDSGFSGFADLMGIEVPATVQARCYQWVGAHSQDLEHCADGGNHGTRVAESVMDIAPDVSLYIADPDTLSDLKATVEWMVSEGVSVINHSMHWEFDGPGDGTSPLSISPLNTVNAAVAAGTVWINAAGNQAQRTWFKRGPFSYSTIDVDGEEVRVLNFDGSDFRNSSHIWGRLVLRWDDSWGGADRNLDLLLARPETGDVNLISADPQTGENWHNPYETVVTGARFDILIAHVGGSEPDWIQLLGWGGTSLNFNTPETGSITSPAESANPGMLAVGAAHWNDVNTIETYSSRGPTPDGRIKPDLVGADCGETASSSLPFCGTSQASPHVAGLAALVRQRFPDYAPAQVASYLKDNAQQRISSTDPNNTWGHGFIVLPPTSQQLFGSPSIDSVTPDVNALTVAWRAPAGDGGSVVTAYDLRHIETAADETVESNWTVVEDVWTSGSDAPSYELTGLQAGTQYDVQVRAVNSADDGPWSTTVTGVPTIAETPCSTGSAVPNPHINQALVADCDTLLAIRDTLAGSGTLNWSASTPITDWDGVAAVEGNPQRVTVLYLPNQGLSGTLPPGLGELHGLEQLTLSNNELTGAIPPELADLSGLNQIFLGGNQLTGAIPPELGGLDGLQGLELYENNLTGTIPSELGSLANLQALHLDTNQLTGPIPPELGSLTNLRWLTLHDNLLTGEIPSELVRLTNLEQLYLSGNRFSECVPFELRSVRETDRTHRLREIGIPYCDVLLRGMGITPAELRPEFDPYVTNYTAAATASSVTVSPTSRHNASFQYVDQNDGVLADADSTQAGHQVDVPVGMVTSIRVKVATEDGIDSRTYRIEVTGLGGLAAPSIRQVTGLVDSLSVSWRAPTQTGGSEVTAFDLRHVRSDAPSKVDPAWTVTHGVWSGSGALSHELTGLEGGVQYDIQVRAVNETGDGPWSATVTGKPTGTVPGAPTGLTATTNGQTQVDLAWSAPLENGGTAVTGYRIEVSPDASAWTDLVADTRSTFTSYSHTGLAAGTTRHYRVSAINSEGSGPSSNVASSTTESPTAMLPNAPTGLTATANGQTQINLSWSAPITSLATSASRASFEASTPSGYTAVELRDNGSVWGVPEKFTSDSNLGTVAYMLLGTLRGCSFVNSETDRSSRVYVKTEQTGRHSSFESESVCRKRSSSWGSYDGMRITHLHFYDESSPANTREHTYESASGQYVETSTGSASGGGSDISGYRIEVSEDGSNWSDLVSDTRSSRNSYSHTGLMPNSTRYYRVSAISAAGTGPASNVVSTRTGAATQPDLAVDTPTVSSSALTAGASFTLNATVRNQGNGSSDSTTLRYYQSTDSTITTGDTQVGTDSVSGLSALTSGDESVSLTAPSTPGTYYYGGCVDAVSDETNTTNNCSLAVMVTVGAAPAPDLVVDTPTVDTSAPAAGARFTLNATVRNQGSGAANSTTLRYYQSTDATITTGDTSVGTDSVFGLGASASGAEWVNLTAPSEPGTYYYGACVDVVSDETNTTNNCSLAVTVTVGSAPAPDLVVDTPTVDNSAPAPGARFALNATVRNQGIGSSAFTTLRYYRSTESTITAGDTAVGTDSVGGLSAAGSSAESISLTAPSTAGTYYYGACVDSVSDESDTTNNCSSAVTVTVGAAPAPDLVVNTPTVSESAPAAGAKFTLNATVRNQGNGRSIFTTLRYYQSSDSTITTGDAQVGTDSVSPLDVSESGDESVSLAAPSEAGNYYYGACVDAVSDESDTTNNCSSAVTVTVGAAPTPDLAVDTPSVSDSAPAAGASFTLNAMVRNQGNGSSDSTTLRYHQSTDSTITTGDTQVGTDSVSRLSASSSGYESVSLTAPSTPGTYYYGACVDTVSGESDTNNNCSASVTVTVGAAPAPDLIVDSLTVSDSAPAAGASITLNATVRNQGNGRSDSTTLRYYQSTDQTIPTGDTEVDSDFVFGLSASRTGNGSASLTAPSNPGTYYYGACVDTVTGESDTNNNCSSAVTVTVGSGNSYGVGDFLPGVPTSGLFIPARVVDASVSSSGGSTTITFTNGGYIELQDGTRYTCQSTGGCGVHNGEVTQGTLVSQTTSVLTSDLIVDPPTVSQSAPAAGTSITLNATVRNQGNGRSDSTTLRYYRSTDATITTSDISVGTDSVTRLNASGSSPESISLNAPSTARTYHYGACVDSVTSESDTTNNCSVAVMVTVGAAPAPDLVVDTSTVSNSSPNAGASFTLSATVRNQGNGSSAFTTLRYYRSIDATITTSDTGVGTDSVLGLSSTESSNESISLAAPMDPGTSYYGACVDAVSGESDTANNCSSAVTVTVGASVSVPGSPTGLTATANGSTGIDLSWTAPTNTGGSEITGYKIEVSTSGSTWNDLVANTNSTATSYSHTDLMAGSTRHYRVSAINSEETGPASSSDSATTSQGATGGPDLVVITPTVTHRRPTPNLIFGLTVGVRNDGNDPSPATAVSYYRSTSPTIVDNPSANNTRVGDAGSVESLEASGSVDLTVNLTAPGTTGTYYYGACVKAVTGESNTRNNCSSTVAVTVQTSNRPPRLTGDIDDKTVELGESFTVDLSGLFTDPDGDDITSYGFTYRTRGILTGTVNTRTGILSLRAIAVGETIVAVEARDSHGVSGASQDLFTVTVDARETAEKPGAPTGLTATADGQTEIDLSWTAPTNTGDSEITGYKIEVSTSGSTWNDLVANTNSTATSYSHTDLMAGSTRHYRVSAINSAGTGPASYVDNDTTATADSATGAPDLIVENTVLSTNTAGGRHWSPNVTVRNLGDGSSAPTTLRYFRSADSTITVSDIEFDTDSVDGLDPSASSREATGLFSPTTPGTYYYGACVDEVPGESDTTNNCSTATVTYVRASVASTPDLAVDTPTVSESSPIDGGSFTLNATVRNQGGGTTSSTTLRYFRSADAIITASDTEIGTNSVSELSASGSSDESISLTASSNPGTYYYGACVDKVSGESDTTNNCSAAVTVTVGAAPAPDLIVSTFTVRYSSPVAGQYFIMDVTVNNQGNGISSSTTLRYVRSTDATITTSDARIPIGGRPGFLSVDGLNPSGSVDKSASTQAPSTPGTYHYGACVETVTGESDTTNNCSPAATVTVQATTLDLVVDTPAVSDSNLTAGNTFALSFTVRNQGNRSSHAIILRYYRSDDAEFDNDDTLVGTQRDDSGVSSDGERSFTSETIIAHQFFAPSSDGRFKYPYITDGTYHYIVCVYPSSEAEDSDTTNNCSNGVAVKATKVTASSRCIVRYVLTPFDKCAHKVQGKFDVIYGEVDAFNSGLGFIYYDFGSLKTITRSISGRGPGNRQTTVHIINWADQNWLVKTVLTSAGNERIIELSQWDN